MVELRGSKGTRKKFEILFCSVILRKNYFLPNLEIVSSNLWSPIPLEGPGCDRMFISGVNEKISSG